MKLRYFFVGFALMFIMQRLEAQNPWKIEAEHFSRDNYFGVTIANGMLGIVSSPDPLKSSNVVLAGSYDNFARGRVSNFMEGFNMLNTLIAIDQEEIEFSNISLFKQNLDMRKASFNTSFQFEDKAIIETSMQSLRQLPFCAMQTIIITPLKDIKLYVANQHETPKAFRDPKMMTNDIKSELIRLITTQAKSPSGKFDVCASSTFLFPNAEKPRLTNSIPDNDLHLAEFQIELKKGQVYEFSVVGATLTSEHHPDPLNEAERLTIYAALEG